MNRLTDIYHNESLNFKLSFKDYFHLHSGSNWKVKELFHWSSFKTECKATNKKWEQDIESINLNLREQLNAARCFAVFSFKVECPTQNPNTGWGLYYKSINTTALPGSLHILSCRQVLMCSIVEIIWDSSMGILSGTVAHPLTWGTRIFW